MAEALPTLLVGSTAGEAALPPAASLTRRARRVAAKIYIMKYSEAAIVFKVGRNGKKLKTNVLKTCRRVGLWWQGRD